MQNCLKFQFHNGSIKSFTFRQLPKEQLGFNSTMVRLKDVFIAQLFCCINMFQFHNGSIKSCFAASTFIDLNVFQFHNGSIKSIGRDYTMSSEYKFQFHNGSIKSGSETR